MRESNYHIFFGMLANKLKLDIVDVLVQKPMGATEIAGRIGAERSRVSHALLSLEKCNLLQAERNGKYRVYSLNKDTMIPLMRLVDRHVSRHCKYCWSKDRGEISRRS